MFVNQTHVQASYVVFVYLSKTAASLYGIGVTGITGSLGTSSGFSRNASSENRKKNIMM